MKKITEIKSLEKKIQRWMIFFIVSLVLSGITAFPLQTELTWVNDLCNEYLNESNSLKYWINYVYEGVQKTNQQFPYMAYGTDWLAFAHIVIAVFFIGVFIDPVKNSWVLQAGMIACVLVIPLAMIAGQIRGIPFYWRLIDCSFGIFGIIPLLIVFKMIKKLEFLKEDFFQKIVKKGATNELYR